MPYAARRGVGTALVQEMERVALEDHLVHAHLSSSLTAEPSYAALEYEVESRGAHRLPPGVSMAAVHIQKRL
jgi:hypothetical protein